MPPFPTLKLKNMKQASKVVEIKSDFFGAYENIAQLRKMVREWLRDTFLGLSIKNEQTGFVIEFNGVSFKKFTSGGGIKRLISSYKIGSIIRNGILVNTRPDTKNRKDILKVYIFKCEIDYEGKIEDYTFIVRQTCPGKFFYDGYVVIPK